MYYECKFSIGRFLYEIAFFLFPPASAVPPRGFVVRFCSIRRTGVSPISAVS